MVLSVRKRQQFFAARAVRGSFGSTGALMKYVERELRKEEKRKLFIEKKSNTCVEKKHVRREKKGKIILSSLKRIFFRWSVETQLVGAFRFVVVGWSHRSGFKTNENVFLSFSFSFSRALPRSVAVCGRMWLRRNPKAEDVNLKSTPRSCALGGFGIYIYIYFYFPILSPGAVQGLSEGEEPVRHQHRTAKNPFCVAPSLLIFFVLRGTSRKKKYGR